MNMIQKNIILLVPIIFIINCNNGLSDRSNLNKNKSDLLTCKLLDIINCNTEKVNFSIDDVLIEINICDYMNVNVQSNTANIENTAKGGRLSLSILDSSRKFNHHKEIVRISDGIYRICEIIPDISMRESPEIFIAHRIKIDEKRDLSIALRSRIFFTLNNKNIINEYNLITERINIKYKNQ